jgi:hypothetical protein
MAGQVGFLMDRQGIHVGAQPDDARRRMLALDDTDNAGAAHAGHDFIDTKGLELFGHDGRRAVHVKEQFGMLVKIPAPCGNFGGQGLDAVKIGHETPGLA